MLSNKATILICALVVVVIATVVVLAWPREFDGRQLNDDIPITYPTTLNTETSGPVALGREAIAVAPVPLSATLHFSVQDSASRRALAGVSVVTGDDPVRVHEARSPLDHTDTLGNVILERARCGLRVTFSHPSFVPQSVLIDGRSRYHVLMERGVTLDVRIITPDGHPVSGASVVVSASPLPSAHELYELTRKSVIAGSDARTSLFFATTGVEGTAQLHCLPSGKVSFCVMARGYEYMKSEPPLTEVPCARVDITVLPLFAATLKVVDDEVLALRLTTPTTIGPNLFSATLEEHRFALMKDLGLSYCKILTKPDDITEEQMLDRKLPAMAFLANRGWVDCVLALQKLSCLVDGQALVPAKPPCGCGILDFQILNADDSVVAITEIVADVESTSAALASGEGRKTNGILIKTGRTTLPCGRYAIRPFGPLANSIWKDPLVHEVRDSETCTVVVKTTTKLTPVQIVFKNEHGVPYQWASIRVTYAESKRRLGYELFDGLPTKVFWWPEGVATIRVVAGQLIGEAVATINGGDAVQTVHITKQHSKR
jgi:hypothetical protein